MFGRLAQGGPKRSSVGQESFVTDQAAKEGGGGRYAALGGQLLGAQLEARPRLQCGLATAGQIAVKTFPILPDTGFRGQRF